MENKERNLGIDLMRIVCMLMIVIYHVQGHGGILQESSLSSGCYMLLVMLQSVWQCAVDGYAMISGYVSLRSRYRYSSLLLLWLRVWLYSVGITAVFWLIAPEKVSYAEIGASLTPVLSGQYWFFTAYAGCFLLAPFVHTAVRQMSNRQAGTVIACVMIVYSILPTLVRKDPFGTDSGNRAIWLLILYAVGAYAAKSDLFACISRGTAALYMAGAAAVCMLSGYALRTLSVMVTGERTSLWYFVRNDSPTTVLLALSMLAFFSKLTVRRCGRLVRALAPLCLSVYLIHDHPLMRENVIARMGDVLVQLPEAALLPAVLLCALAISAVCYGVDEVRERIFGRLNLRGRIMALEMRLIGEMWKDE